MNTASLKIGACMAAVVTGQWADLTSFVEPTTKVITTFTKDQPVALQKNNCFQVSQIKGRTDYATTFTSDFSKLKTGWYHGMYMSKVRVCGTSTSFEGIQATIRDETRFANLKQIG